MNLDDYIAASIGTSIPNDFLVEYKDLEIYFPLGNSELEDGSVHLPPGDGLEVKIVEGDGLKLMLFYALRQDQRLGKKFAGIPLCRAAQLVVEFQGVDGMLLQSSGDAWIVVKKEALMEIVPKS